MQVSVQDGYGGPEVLMGTTTDRDPALVGDAVPAEAATKAIVRRRYGPPAALEYTDVARPVVRKGDVLVRVRAASVHPGDYTRQALKPFLSVEKREDLRTLAGWLEAGELTPVIDRTYQLSAAADALRYVGAGHTRGKVVITV